MREHLTMRRLWAETTGALCVIMASSACLVLGACATRDVGYGIGPQAEPGGRAQPSMRETAPDTPAMYLSLIGNMQARGLYYASLAHLDAYESQHGATPESILLRADALRATGQQAASLAAYRLLLTTPLAARGYRGLGLLAGGAGDFGAAVQALEHAAALAPTDVATLSDLGYALLRSGDVARARVPLMEAAELDEHNRKVIGNVALYLLAAGQAARAQALIDEQKLAPAVREQLREEAVRVEAAMHRRRPDGAMPPLHAQSALLAAPAAPVAGRQ